jgi:hypothetical protein
MSTRYQEQVDAISKSISELKDGSTQQFQAYREKVALLGGYGEAYFEGALKTLGEKKLTVREEKVMEVLAVHVRDYNAQRRADAERWLQDFEKAFESFGD